MSKKCDPHASLRQSLCEHIKTWFAPELHISPVFGKKSSNKTPHSQNPFIPVQLCSTWQQWLDENSRFLSSPLCPHSRVHKTQFTAHYNTRHDTTGQHNSPAGKPRADWAGFWREEKKYRHRHDSGPGLLGASTRPVTSPNFNLTSTSLPSFLSSPFFLSPTFWGREGSSLGPLSLSLYLS